MRIVQIINGLQIGGAEKLVKDFHNRYLSRGEESTVISLTGAKQGWLSENIYSLGLSSPYDPRTVTRLVAASGETGLDKADIIHVHLFPARIVACLVHQGMNLAGHLITTEHNTHNRRRGTLLGKLADMYSYRICQQIICVSEGVLEQLQAWVPEISEKLRVIYNGIDINLFSPADFKLLDDDCTIVSVGSLTLQKNYFNAISVFSELSSRGHSNIRYLIAGSGKLESELRKTVKDLGVSGIVELLGNVSDIPGFLRKADLFFMPSSWEGFGIAAVEAMASGIPVIASDVQGIREVVGSDGSCGLLVDADSVSEMADAIECLSAERSRAREMGRNAIERASLFSIEKTVDEHLCLYRDAIDEGIQWK